MLGKKTTSVFFIIFSLVGYNHGIYLETFRTGVWKVPEDTLHNLTVSLRFNSSLEYGSGSPRTSTDQMDLQDSKLIVRVAADEDWKLDFVNPVAEFTVEEVLANANKSITFSGYYWGLSQLTFFLVRNDLDSAFLNDTVLRDDLMIIIDRKVLALDTAFIAFGLTFMVINNVMMGSQLDLQLIISVLKKPLGPLCGFISQFTIMPVLTFVFGKVFFDDPLQRLGLFTLGCCPGGTMSNFWTLMFDGDINLSITMTAVSTVAAMGMMPLWLFTLGKSLLDENDNLQIPYANLAFSLIGLTIPVGIGIFMKHKKPEWAIKAKKIIKPFTLVVILFFMILGTYNSYKVFLLMTSPMVIAGFLVAMCGYVFGAAFAKLLCLSADKVIAISIETAMQNPAVAFILLKLSLPSPNGDLAALPIMATMMLTGPPVMVFYAIYALSKRFCRCCRKGDNLEENTEKTDLSALEKDQMGLSKDQNLRAQEKDNFLRDQEKDHFLRDQEKNNFLRDQEKDHFLRDQEKDHFLRDQEKDHFLRDQEKDRFLPNQEHNQEKYHFLHDQDKDRFFQDGGQDKYLQVQGKDQQIPQDKKKDHIPEITQNDVAKESFNLAVNHDAKIDLGSAEKDGEINHFVKTNHALLLNGFTRQSIKRQMSQTDKSVANGTNSFS